jgi:TolB protein
VPSRLLRSSLLFLFVLLTLMVGVRPARAQEWFRTGTGLGVEKPRVAVADFAPRADTAKPHSTLFAQVVRDDLGFSGILDVVSPSFYPTTQPSVPSELRYVAWSDPPVNAHFVAFGNLSETSEVAIQAWFYDVTNPTSQAVIAKIYRGAPTDAQVRKFAHQFADEIIMRLSGGLPGIASTQIAFVSSRTSAKELWVMDYDGANQHPLTSLRSISLTPRWAPDTSRIAFTCYTKTGVGPASPHICMYSVDAGKVVSFPHFKGTNSAPSWSPDGSQLVFSSSMAGNPELYGISSGGSGLKRLTFANGASTSPVWNPKTGQSIAFVSDRTGVPKLYLMNSDGTNAQNLDLPDKGYLIDPSWAPNGQLLAFSWRRPTGNYDIYVMEVASRQIIELTRDAGRNERPSWAPDGRHIVFESTRSGTRQIWTMLADGTQARQLTTSGHNESPNWSQR